ncbi:MAG TPA: hypothetical protein V6D48_01640 [Oculatellaceae cyanobacterium]
MPIALALRGAHHVDPPYIPHLKNVGFTALLSSPPSAADIEKAVAIATTKYGVKFPSA